MTTPLLFGLQIGVLLALLLLFITLLLTRQREAPRFLAGINLFLLGIFVFILSMLIQLAASIRALFRILILPASVLENLQSVDVLVLLPLLGICLLLGVLLLRDRFAA